MKYNFFTLIALASFAFVLSIVNQKSSFPELKISNVEALSQDGEGPDPNCLYACYYGSNGCGTDYFQPQFFDGYSCFGGLLMYYGYPPCGDIITVNYGSTGSTCWMVTVTPN